MSKIHTDELSLFSIPPTNGGIERVQWIDFRPVSQVVERGPIEFIITGNTLQYIDLHKTKLHAQLKIENVETDVAVGADKVTLINLPLHTLWSQVDISLQQQATGSGTGSNYGYKAYIEHLLNCGEDVKKTRLTAELFYADRGSMDAVDPLTAENEGLTNRYIYTRNGRTVDVEGCLRADLCLQRRLILNGVNVGVKLWPSKDAFRLMSAHDDKTHKVTLTDIYLNVCKVTVTPSVILAHNEALSITPAKYPYQKTAIKVFTLPAGQFTASLDDLFQGTIPTRLVAGLVSSAAYSGDIKQNPFNFQHYDTNHVAMYVDGESVPSQPLKPNFENDQFVDAHLSLFTVSGKDGQGGGNAIERPMYKRGYTLFGFVVDPTAADDLQYWPEQRRGHTRFEIKFSKPLPESISLILYATFPALLQIDAARNVIQ